MNELPAPTARGGRRHNNAQKTRQSVSCPWYLFSFRSTLYDAGNSRSYAKPILLFPFVPRPSEERRKDGKIRQNNKKPRERKREKRGKKKRKRNQTARQLHHHPTEPVQDLVVSRHSRIPIPGHAQQYPSPNFQPTNQPAKRREEKRKESPLPPPCHPFSLPNFPNLIIIVVIFHQRRQRCMSPYSRTTQKCPGR